MGQYKIVRELGKGGMGEVYEAENDVNHKRVALKVLPRAATGGTFVDRFRLESRVMMDIRHPNTVQVHHAGEENGIYYLTMDLVLGAEGQPFTLEDLLASRGGGVPGEAQSGMATGGDKTGPLGGKGPKTGAKGSGPGGNAKGRLSSTEAAKLALQICDAVAYAHQRQIIHRDLKPANVLIDAEGEAHVADFGLAKVVGTEYLQAVIQSSISISLAQRSIGEAATMQGHGGASSSAQSLLGTYDYMAPEQKGGGDVSTRSDVFALGVILYRMLTGRKPEGRFKEPSHYGQPKAWDAIVSKCLEPDPDERYADAGELKAAIARLAGVPGAHAKAGSGRGLGVAMAVAGIVAVVAAGGGAWLWLQRPPQDTPARRMAEERKTAAEKVWNEIRSGDPARVFGHSISNLAAEMGKAEQMFKKGRWDLADQEYRALDEKLGRMTETDGLRRDAERALAASGNLADDPVLGPPAKAAAEQLEAAAALLGEGREAEAAGKYRETEKALRTLGQLGGARKSAGDALSALSVRTDLDPGHGFGERLENERMRLADGAKAIGEGRYEDALALFQEMPGDLRELESLNLIRMQAVRGIDKGRVLDSGEGFGTRLGMVSGWLEEAAQHVVTGNWNSAREQFEKVARESAEIVQRDAARQTVAGARLQARDQAKAETDALAEWKKAEDALSLASATFAEGKYADAEAQWKAAVPLYKQAGEKAQAARQAKRSAEDQKKREQAALLVADDYKSLAGLPSRIQRTKWLQQTGSEQLMRWKAAAGQGVPEAKVLLAGLYLEGILVEKSESMALELVEQAAVGEAPPSEALACLGELKEARGAVTDWTEAAALYLRAAEAGSVRAQGALGRLFLLGRGIRRDESMAAEWLEKAAAAGHPEALAYQGWMLENGLGEKGPDVEAARVMYQQAAANGAAAAQSCLGRLYERGAGGLKRDDVRAVLLAQQAAKAGDADGFNLLGNMIEDGRGGLDLDEEMAVKCYQRAAAMGNASALNNLGRMHEEGMGGAEQSHARAKVRYLQAAALGDLEGRYNLARAYAGGWGETSADHQAAEEHFLNAGRRGHAAAQLELGRIYEQSRPGVSRDPAKMEYWYLESGEQGVLEAQKSLARIYARGMGTVLKSDSDSAKWHQAAAEQGDLDSQLSIAAMYDEGIGVDVDEAGAARWYRKAAEQGSPFAQFQLGCMYRDGRGVDLDDRKAVEWLRKAANQGDAQAQKHLNRQLNIMRKNGIDVD